MCGRNQVRLCDSKERGEKNGNTVKGGHFVDDGAQMLVGCIAALAFLKAHEAVILRFSIMRIFCVQHGATSKSISRRLFLEDFCKVDDRTLE